jgi:hypothetical protein
MQGETARATFTVTDSTLIGSVGVFGSRLPFEVTAVS